MQERGVHLDPVTGNVEGYHHLEEEEVGRVEVAQNHYQACSGTSVARRKGLF